MKMVEQKIIFMLEQPLLIEVEQELRVLKVVFPIIAVIVLLQ